MKHNKKRLVIILCCSIMVFAATVFSKQLAAENQHQDVILSAQDRILILAPHPDDEVLGCGGIIQKAMGLKIPVRIVFLTYGDNNQWSFLLYRKHPVIMPKSVRSMGQVRHTEALAADKILGVTPEQLIFLGYPDFRTLKMWYAGWGMVCP